MPSKHLRRLSRVLTGKDVAPASNQQQCASCSQLQSAKDCGDVEQTTISPTSTKSTTSNDSPTSSVKTRSPSLDSIRSVNELMDIRFKECANQPYVCFPYRSKGRGKLDSLEFEMITYGQLGCMVQNAANKLNDRFPARKKGKGLGTVGMFCTSELNFVVNEMALIRLGHAVLIISPNNSAQAVVHLMETTSCKDLVYSPAQKTIAEEAIKILQSRGSTIQSQDWVTIKEAKDKGDSPRNTQVRSEWSYAEESEELFSFTHSSGSTGHPKPIGRRHRDFTRNEWLSAVHGLILAPIFHTMCHGLVLTAMMTKGSVILLPSSLPISSANLAELSRKSVEKGFTCLYAVPLMLKLLVDATDGFDTLSKFSLVCFAGAAVPKALGDLLTEANVNLVSNYGSTETRVLLTSKRDFKTDKHWDILRPTESFKPFMKMEEVWKEDEEPVYELICDKAWRNRALTNRPDGSYATSDLFKRSHTIKDGYLYCGRLDDTIVHFNGEKTNPLPMEQEIRSSPFVREVIIFGSGHLQVGCLIIPYSDDGDKDETMLMSQIWPAIQRANQEAPTHSRIVQELVHILPHTTRFPSADKGTVIRAKTLKAYESLIGEIYRMYEDGNNKTIKNGNQSTIQNKYKVNTLERAKKLARSCVLTALKDQKGTELSIPDDDANLFDLGCDSITVVRIGNLIRTKAELPDSKSFRPYAPFDYPSIKLMSQLLVQLSNGNIRAAEQASQSESKTITDMLDRLSKRIEPRRQSIRKSRIANLEGDCFVLTGATGALGAHLLVQICQIPSVEKVICLCRAKSLEEAEQRVEESLQKRKLGSEKSLADLEVSTNTKILCLASDLNKSDLGLNAKQGFLDEILNEATHIIHNAWPVNFSMGIAAFESSLNGLINLLNICSFSYRQFPPSFTFCSSISAISNIEPDFESGTIMERLSNDPRHASHMGYGRSKWIAETLCEKATKRIKGIRCMIARIGQLACDTNAGIWNEKEAWPALLKTAQILGCLPDLRSKPLRWLPIDTAATLIVAAMMTIPDKKYSSDENILKVVHFTNPHSTGWINVIEAMRQSRITFKIVPLETWVKLLANGKEQDPFSNPAIKLLSFYNSWTEDTGKDKEMDISQLQEVLKERPDLTDRLRPINTVSLMKTIQAWKASGFFDK
ncbi:hypothetical protein L7F22_039361 [Adiantum nelumboides]|nr:hypothetical protein [Adiantum nelumboides]